jgi:hypothetical protein
LSTPDGLIAANAEDRGAVPVTSLEDIMIGLILASTLAASSNSSALDLCKPMLARKAGGGIAKIEVISSTISSKGRTLKGQLTAFLGMGPPAPGSASAHHLIRADFGFRCRIDRGRVREATVVSKQ